MAMADAATVKVAAPQADNITHHIRYMRKLSSLDQVAVMFEGGADVHLAHLTEYWEDGSQSETYYIDLTEAQYSALLRGKS